MCGEFNGPNGRNGHSGRCGRREPKRHPQLTTPPSPPHKLIRGHHTIDGMYSAYHRYGDCEDTIRSRTSSFNVVSTLCGRADAEVRPCVPTDVHSRWNSGDMNTLTGYVSAGGAHRRREPWAVAGTSFWAPSRGWASQTSCLPTHASIRPMAPSVGLASPLSSLDTYG